jgi:hypothetical protein
MIIVEGPDGAGKTSLIDRLKAELHLPVHERSANSDSSATMNTESTRGANLAMWAYKDVTTMDDQVMAIYDRHCLISEFVYGPIVRGYLDPNMLAPPVHFLIREMAKRCLVIFCRPPDKNVIENTNHDVESGQVVGDHHTRIAYGYDALKMFWPGENMRFDYTAPYDYDSVLSACRLHIANWNRSHNV